MFSYLLDIICALNTFTGLGSSWSPKKPPVHFYFKDLWKNMYKFQFSLVYGDFLVPLYELFFCKTCPIISPMAMEVLKDIGDWYIYEYSTYLRIYGVTHAPHTLLYYVPNGLIIQELDTKPLYMVLMHAWSNIKKIVTQLLHYI